MSVGMLKEHMLKMKFDVANAGRSSNQHTLDTRFRYAFSKGSQDVQYRFLLKYSKYDQSICYVNYNQMDSYRCITEQITSIFCPYVSKFR